jgi:hypothetical protein
MKDRYTNLMGIFENIKPDLLFGDLPLRNKHKLYLSSSAEHKFCNPIWFYK